VLLRKNGKVNYRAMKVERGAVQSLVTATGTLNALVTVQVGSQVSGRIMELKADFNSVVRKGQVVAHLDPALFEAQVEQARANLASSTANVERMRVAEAEAARALRRGKELFAQRLISESEREAAQSAFDSAVANVRSADAQREQAQASLNSATVNLEHTTIYAPVDGIVISRDVDVGQTVAASLQAPTLFTIAGDLRQMQVHSNISEADVGRIQVGQKATFSVDAFPERKFEGTLTQIRNSPTTVQNVVTYIGIIDVSNDDLALKPGMTATVSILAARRDGVLKLPNIALRFKPPTAAASAPGQNQRPGATGSRRQSVWILDQGRLKNVPVRTGISDGTFSEILEGDLREGSDVVVETPSAASGTPPPRMFGPGRMR